MKQLRRGYPQLTVWERVQLFLAARERGDLSEANALDEACPRAHLPDYALRLGALQNAASFLVVQLLATNVLLLARLADLPSGAPSDPAADPHLLSLLQRQAALWRAFVAYCQSHDHDPHQVLHLAPLGLDEGEPASLIVHQQLHILEALPDDLPTDPAHDPDQFLAWRNLFARAFPPHPPF
jgi:hypothetical protein